MYCSHINTTADWKKTTTIHNQPPIPPTSLSKKPLTVLILLPTVLPIESANNNINKNTICTLTLLSTAVLLIGAAVALRINFVSCPVNTTTPYAQGVLRSWAPRRRSWSGPRGTCLGVGGGEEERRSKVPSKV